MTVSILIFLPVIAALVVLFIKGSTAKYAAFIFGLANLVITGVFLSRFVPNAATQFSVTVPWIPKAGIYFSAGIDGISMIMVILTTLLVPLIILTTFKHQYKNAPVFYALVLFMQAGLLTVFTALDGFLFYVGWEVALIPIYFICALWGGENRIKVNIKFFIYTFAGSLFMLLAIIYLRMQNPTGLYDLHQFYENKLDGTHQSWIFWA
ncbi:MAG: complex I subunit 4 family protein, partial [Mucilaginibacter sp.]